MGKQKVFDSPIVPDGFEGFQVCVRMFKGAAVSSDSGALQSVPCDQGMRVRIENADAVRRMSRKGIGGEPIRQGAHIADKLQLGEKLDHAPDTACMVCVVMG